MDWERRPTPTIWHTPTGFSSPAYFSRYVQQHLGVNPSDYRGG